MNQYATHTIKKSLLLGKIQADEKNNDELEQKLLLEIMAEMRIADRYGK